MTKKIMLSLILLLFSNLIEASTYTITWCPVKGTTYYIICQETNISSSLECNGIITYTNKTQININLNNETEWIKVRALAYKYSNGLFYPIYSEYSVAVEVINGLTPPIINCGC